MSATLERSGASPARALIAPAPTCALPPPAEKAGPVQVKPLAVFGALALALLWWVGSQYGAQKAVLLALGLGLGVALFHSRFGFTSGWRQLVAVGNGAGLRAHALLVGTTATIAALLLGTGTGLFGTTPAPAGGPLGVGLLAGAFIFGLGMQLGGACASGTLFAVGAGQASILLTLFGFIVGSVLYTWQYGLVDDLPAFEPIVLGEEIGWFGSWAVTIAALLLVVWGSKVYQARRNPPPTSPAPTAHGFARVIRGSWPMLVGAVVLAVLAVGVLLVSGGIWGVTSAFALWGTKVLQVLGAHPEEWAYWQQAAPAKQLAAPVLSDKNTLTNVGIMIGAGLAAAAGGTYTLRHRVPWKVAVAAVLGGIMLGIGARLAQGCNIGAYLGGISTGSLSGWVWGVAALAGTWVGLKLRPLFGLGVPKADDSVC
ncbi:YeeE/YedE family protein [Pedococcus aerophilus]|uniref:YeeE/YedE family protein n=1 Tax=Pedococcus aerophilus TaxID=436356 RepID=A0ABP6H6Y9_9MICO